jgi:hypothetical protein
MKNIFIHIPKKKEKRKKNKEKKGLTPIVGGATLEPHGRGLHSLATLEPCEYVVRCWFDGNRLSELLLIDY